MSNYQTIRGIVSNLKYIEQTGRSMRYTDKPDSATTITFDVGGRAVVAANSGFPPLSSGDEVEVVGVSNPRSGILEAAQLSNHTSGATWKFSAWRPAWRNPNL